MRKQLYSLMGFLAVVLGCSGATDPAVPSLDGPWSSGHTAIGLDMALTLTWTRDHVAGNGSYAMIPPPVHCGSATIAAGNTVVLTATRPSPAEVSGQMTFGTGTPIPYQGTLIATAQNAGFERIEGFLVAPDGTQCALTMFRGLVP